jgi:hypothetical protein
MSKKKPRGWWTGVFLFWLPLLSGGAEVTAAPAGNASSPYPTYSFFAKVGHQQGV